MSNEVKKGPIVADTGTYDYKQPPEANPVKPTRQITLTVPSDIPDAVVQYMWSLGERSYRVIGQGLGLFIHPTLMKGADGKMINSIGSATLLIATDEDAHRVVSLIMMQNDINQKLRQDTKNPINAINAGPRAEAAKAQAARRAANDAQHKPTIEIAKGKLCH